jgi:uncharacterized protein YjbI with pentapeptide repeats
LTAYLREKHPAHALIAPRVLSASRYQNDGFVTCDQVVRKPKADTQAALIAILRTAAKSPGGTAQLDLSGLDLAGVEIDGRSFRGANLTGSSLAFARATKTNFDGADLERADMRYTCLVEATFKNTMTFGAPWWTWGGANVAGVDFFHTSASTFIKTAEEAEIGYDSLSRAQIRGTNWDDCTRTYFWHQKRPPECGTSDYIPH